MRYFQSQLWEQHRASVRKTANDSTNKKKDDIFDAYLEDPDWELAPRKEVDEGVGRVIDLAATQEDHGDVSFQCQRLEGFLGKGTPVAGMIADCI